MSLFKILFIIVFIMVLISLGTALFFLTTGDSKNDTRMVKALTLRISLSIGLILLLLFGYFTGLIQPQM